MRNICKSIIVVLALFYTLHTEAHKYTLHMTNWSYSNRQVTNVTYSYSGGSFSISRGSPSVTFSTGQRITNFTVHITGFYSLDPNGTGPAYDFTGNYTWASDDLSMDPGDAGVYPICNWDPGITIEARDAGTGALLPNNSIIDCDKKVQINILDKHGYTGDVTLYLGKVADFTVVDYPLVTMGGTATNFIPDNSWNKFLSLFGSVSGTLTQGFYIKPLFTYPDGTHSSSLGIGPFNLKDYITVSPNTDGSAGICGPLWIKPRHLLKPFAVEISQNSKIYSALCNNDSLVIDQNILATKGFVTNTASFINIKNTGGNITTRTRLVRFLQPAPDTTNKQFIYNKRSCEETDDGSLTILLPEKDYSYDLRFSYRDLQDVPVVLTTNSNVIVIPLDPGSYNFIVDYNIGPTETGCATSLGTNVIESVPQLKITSINATKIPTCSYSEDAELTINAEGGVPGTRSYVRLPDLKSYAANVIPGLKGGTTYSFKAVDSKGCESASFTGTTLTKTQLQATVTGNGIIKCFGDLCNETLSASGGNPGYVYSVNGVNANSGPYAFKGNLHVTEYEIIVTDSKGCKDTIYSSFPEPPELKFRDPAYTLSQFNAYNLRCNNDLSGIIKLNKTGGTGPIQFTLTGPNGDFGPQADSSFINLSAGLFSASMTDTKGCITELNEPVVLTQPPGIEFSEPDITHETCFGTGDAVIETHFSGTASSFQWFRSETVMTGKNNRILTDVPSGNYKLEAKYNAGACSTVSPLYVIPPAPQISISTLTHESCSDGNGGGQIELTHINNGTGPFSYSFDGGTIHNITSFPVLFENLDPDEYSLEIRDANYSRGGIYSDKCKTTTHIDISPKGYALFHYTVTNPLCFDDSNGKITASVSGPDNPFIHSWFYDGLDSIGTGNLLKDIPDGNYSVLIKDGFNCTINPPAIEVLEPKKLEFTGISSEDAACTMVSDGRITIQEPKGGTKNFQYSLNAGSTWQPNPVFSGLHSGTFPLMVRDAHGCSIDTMVEIGAFHPLITTLGNDSVSCSGFADGHLSFDAEGSKADGLGYTYLLKNSLGGSLTNSTGIFQNLRSGSYNIYARDTKNCFTDTLIQQVGEPAPLDVKLTLKDSASCNQYTGSIIYTISGGNGGNELIWFNTTLGESQFLNINALQTGMYKLTVNDRKACSQSASIIVPDRPAPVITGINLLKKAWCDLPLASAKVNVTSGSPEYSYLWDNSDADHTAIADRLAEGTYHVTVTDRFNCKDMGEIKIVDGPPITLSSHVQHPHCGQNDGSAELIIAGGVPPFLYEWPDSVAENPVTTTVMNDLFSGTYPVVITDSVGCSGSFIVNLSDLNGPNIHSIDISKSWCGLSHGSAEVFASGGTLPYSFNWTSFGSNNVIGINPRINNLRSGKYMIKITDKENCQVLREIQVNDSIELQPVLSLVSIDSSACNKSLGSLSVLMNKGLSPYTYQWNTGVVDKQLQNISKGTYHVKATDQRGCKDSMVLVLHDRKLPVLSLISKESAYCGQANGSATFSGSLGRSPYQVYSTLDESKKIALIFNSSLNRYMGLMDSLLPLPTPYSIRIKDSDGCESPGIGVLIDDDNPLSMDLLNTAAVSCFGLVDGLAEVAVSNGYEPYTYNWNINSVNSNINNSLPAGPFSVTVTDAKECTKTLYIIDNPIVQPEPVSISSAFMQLPSCFGACDGTIAPIAAGGNGDYLYIWNSQDTLQTKNDFCAGDHLLNIYDAKGCCHNQWFTIENPPPLANTNLPASAEVCSGQHYLADPGDDWVNISWTSDNTYASSDHIAKITNPGLYYLSGYSKSGCMVKDTLRLIVSNDLLNAQFLMMSEAYVGDTVVIIEVSWPLADILEWEFPDETNLISNKPNYKEITFTDPGTYYVQLTASLSGCLSVQGKYIEILELSGKPVDEDLPEETSLIRSFSLYPNPADIDFRIKVDLSQAKDIRVEIIGIGSGNTSRIFNEYGLDEYNITVNAEDLMRGTYIIRLIAGNESRTKILVVR